MKETTLGTKAGIKWTFTETLDDLDFADDISLLSHRYGDIQSKSENRARNAGKSIHPESSHAPDSWWHASAGETKGNVANIFRAGDRNIRLELGAKQVHQFFLSATNFEKTLVYFGCGLICNPTQRGLSK